MIDNQHPSARYAAWAILICVVVLVLDFRSGAMLLLFIGLLIAAVWAINLVRGVAAWARRSNDRGGHS